MLQRDLRLAKRLGFRFVRPKIGVVSGDLVPDPIWTESVERSLDLAAELDVVICPEIHSPTPIKHEVVDELHRAHRAHRHEALRPAARHRDLPGPPDPAAARRAAGPAPGVPRRHRRRPGRHRRHREVRRVHPGEVPRHRRATSRTSRSPGSPCSSALKDAGYTGYLSSEYEGERDPLALDRAGATTALPDPTDRRRARLSRGIRPRPTQTDRTRTMPNGLIDDSSLRAHPDGLALSLTLPWYRSLWLSSVSTLRAHASTASRWMPRTSRSSSTACATRSTSCPSRATCSGTCRRTRCSSSPRPQPARPRRDPRDRALRRAAPAVHADRAGQPTAGRASTCRTS